MTNDLALPLSGFWTWDHSTNWTRDGNAVESGCFNRYTKAPESFIEDYRLLMDMMAAQGIPFVIIWGLFRDSHGGEESVRRLLALARERGVKVLAGVGVNAYGGVYWEGDHPFNLATWLRRNPHLAAQRKKSTWPNACGREIACPSKGENVAWAQESLRWLVGNFDVAGVNLETGDYGLCDCDDCRKCAADRSGGSAFEDIARVLPPVVRAACEARPDAVITYATYAPFTTSHVANPPAFTRTIPGRAVCQWTLTAMAGPDATQWPEGLRPTAARNVGFSHWGSQWTNPNTRHRYLLNHIRGICRGAQASGLEGVFIHGEVSPADHFAWRLNYAAFAHFLRRPKDTIEDFARGALAECFGGPDEAVTAVRYLTEIVAPDDLRQRIPACVAADARWRQLPGRPWLRIANELWSRTL